MRPLRSLSAVVLGAGLLAGSSAVLTSTPAHAACSYTVDGYVKVKDFRITGQKTTEPLSDILVKVSGRAKVLGVWGTFNEWGTVDTDANGHFHFEHAECNSRNVKVAVSFDDDELTVKGNGNKTWYDTFNDSVARNPGSVPVNTMTFAAGGKNDLGNSAGRSNAETWVVYRKAIDHLKTIGHPLGLSNLTVHNPFDTIFSGDTSYTDPVTDDIHIHAGDEFDIEAMLHEFGHAVMYPLVSGEDCLTTDLALSLNTHQFRENGCVSFHEGMAEFIGERLGTDMFDAGVYTVDPGSSITPWNRAFVKQSLGLTTLDAMEHNDLGWFQLLKTTGRDSLQLDQFGTKSAAVGTGFVTQRTSCLFHAAPTIGLPKTLTVLDGFDTNPANEIGFQEYLDAAEAELTTVDDSDVDDFLNVVDVTHTIEPCSLFSTMSATP